MEAGSTAEPAGRQGVRAGSRQGPARTDLRQLGPAVARHPLGRNPSRPDGNSGRPRQGTAGVRATAQIRGQIAPCRRVNEPDGPWGGGHIARQRSVDPGPFPLEVPTGASPRGGLWWLGPICMVQQERVLDRERGDIPGVSFRVFVTRGRCATTFRHARASRSEVWCPAAPPLGQKGCRSRGGEQPWLAHCGSGPPGGGGPTPSTNVVRLPRCRRGAAIAAPSSSTP
jgi:hypothetical protein